ncbi:glutamate dehydrogenase, partial [Streptomyces sp. NPDC059165]
MPSTASSSTAWLEDLEGAVLRRNPGEPEFHQAVREVLETLAPVIGLRPEF